MLSLFFEWWPTRAVISIGCFLWSFSYVAHYFRASHWEVWYRCRVHERGKCGHIGKHHAILRILISAISNIGSGGCPGKKAKGQLQFCRYCPLRCVQANFLAQVFHISVTYLSNHVLRGRGPPLFFLFPHVASLWDSPMSSVSCLNHIARFFLLRVRHRGVEGNNDSYCGWCRAASHRRWRLVAGWRLRAGFATFLFCAHRVLLGKLEHPRRFAERPAPTECFLGIMHNIPMYTIQSTFEAPLSLYPSHCRPKAALSPTLHLSRSSHFNVKSFSSMQDLLL